MEVALCIQATLLVSIAFKQLEGLAEVLFSFVILLHFLVDSTNVE